MAKYVAKSETLGADLSNFVPFELCAELRETGTAGSSAAVSTGDIVTVTIGSGENAVSMYGIAAAGAPASGQYPVIVRNAVINAGAYASTVLTAAIKKALVEQGCVIR